MATCSFTGTPESVSDDELVGRVSFAVGLKQRNDSDGEPPQWTLRRPGLDCPFEQIERTN
jgi:hypothetical protein